MKVKKLIELLQQVDPTGELECGVGNEDIFAVYKDPAYYDGCQQILIRDESKNCYNVVAAKITAYGTKVVIRPLSITDAIWENPALEVDTSETNGKYDKLIENWRQSAIKQKLEIEEWSKENGLPKYSTGPITDGNNLK